MTKKQLHQLIDQSYSNAILDRSRVQKNAEKLNRGDLKQFTKALKLMEQKNNVYVTLPNQPTKGVQNEFSSLFPNKKIVYNIDSSIMPGLRIHFGDQLFEVSLKDRLKKLSDYIEQSYD